MRTFTDIRDQLIIFLKCELKRNSLTHYFSFTKEFYFLVNLKGPQFLNFISYLNKALKEFFVQSSNVLNGSKKKLSDVDASIITRLVLICM